MREVTVFGLDVAKNVFEVVGLGRREQVVVSRRLRRKQLLDWFDRQPRVVVGLEACPGSHYWAKSLREMGFPVKMIAAQHAKALRPGHQKNDARDAVAIARATRSDQVPGVAVKSEDQLQMQALFRFREQRMKHWIALGNQVRMQLLEFGVALPKSDKALRNGVEEALESGQLPEMFATHLRHVMEEWRRVKQDIAGLDRELKRLARANDLCVRLMEEPGIGALTAIYAVGVIGGPQHCKNGRQFAARAGLVPRQSNSGDRTQLGSITKAGDGTFRTLVVHGSRSVLTTYRGDSPLAAWGREVAARRGFNKACVAVANRMARQMWAIMNRHVATAG